MLFRSDVEYRNNINTRQRERYHMRKANKAEKLYQEALQKTENDISLGDTTDSTVI